MSRMHKLTRRAFAAAAALTAAALATTLLPGTAQQAAQTPVKIGALLSLTGDLQAYGENCLKGIKLALDQINAAGGILGSPAQVVEADDQTSAQPAIDAAQRLVNVEKVAGIIGALGSGITIPVATTVTAPNEIPQISPASTAPTITTLEDSDFLFRTVPSDAFQGVALAQVTREENLERLAVIYINNDYGKGLADSFKAAFEKQGGKITKAVPYDPGKASYRSELTQLKEGDPQALVLIGYPENGVVILRQALEEGLFDRFVFTDGMRSPDLAAQVGADKLEGSIGTSPQALTDSKAYQIFADAYKAAYGELPPTPYIDTAYDAAFLLALAIQKAGSTDGTAVRDALRQVANPPGTEILPGEWAKAVELLKQGEDINYTGASGSLDFDEKGDVAGTFAHWTFQGGKVVDLKVFEPGS
ncbi:ABC transporter substrate-binding protein [Synechococcus sp. H55.7]|uniref:ABC transporter substrate-binding protein n=1 Tax=unclassified Synechococcus TaxID=2626047 RepID=UPI0039C45718